MQKKDCEHVQEHENAVEKARGRILTATELEKVCGIFRILSEPSRMKIVLALLEGQMCVYHLTEVCGGTVSGISHQLRVLRDNGIVKAQRFGKNIEYSIMDEHVREIVETGKAHLACEKAVF